uniref:Uncharacterized protein n=1 Tax=Anguilla anguilla TaxID=7936 RepID=A0A0E9Q6T9_ANGAN
MASSNFEARKYAFASQFDALLSFGIHVG